MSARVKRHAGTLHVLAKGSPHTRKAILKHADTDLMKCLCECAHNVIKGNIPISTHQKSRLKRYKEDLRSLSSNKGTLAHKRKIVQKGGFLSALLAPLLAPIIAPLATKALGKIFK